MSLPLNEDILLIPRNYNVVWVSVAAVIIVVCVALAFLWKPKAKKDDLGFLAVNDEYLNIGDRLFPASNDNPALQVVLESAPVTVWKKTRKEKDLWQFETQHHGVTYVFGCGVPGWGAPWGAVFLTPEEKEDKSLLFSLKDGEFQAANNMSWDTAESCPYLVEENNNLVWRATPESALPLQFVKNVVA